MVRHDVTLVILLSMRSNLLYTPLLLLISVMAIGVSSRSAAAGPVVVPDDKAGNAVSQPLPG